MIKQNKKRFSADFGKEILFSSKLKVEIKIEAELYVNIDQFKLHDLRGQNQCRPSAHFPCLSDIGFHCFKYFLRVNR